MKKRWTARRGRATRSETAYLRRMMQARAAGIAAGRNPKATERSFPPGYSEEEKSYWLDGFRTQRRKK